MTLHPVLRRLYEKLASPSNSHSQHMSNGNIDRNISAPGTADNRLHQRILFDVGFSFVFLIALHGFSAAKVLLILYVNYNIATKLKRDHVPLVTWIFNVGILFANELGEGYHFGSIANAMQPWLSTANDPGKSDLMSNWGTTLDNYGGLIPRWEVLFNVTVLRLISFNMDYYWSLNQAEGSPIEVRT